MVVEKKKKVEVGGCLADAPTYRPTFVPFPQNNQARRNLSKTFLVSSSFPHLAL